MDLRGNSYPTRIKLCGNALHHADILKKMVGASGNDPDSCRLQRHVSTCFTKLPKLIRMVGFEPTARALSHFCGVIYHHSEHWSTSELHAKNGGPGRNLTFNTKFVALRDIRFTTGPKISSTDYSEHGYLLFNIQYDNTDSCFTNNWIST